MAEFQLITVIMILIMSYQISIAHLPKSLSIKY